MSKREIRALQLGDLHPGGVSTFMPVLEQVDPRALLIDDVYQRGLSERSISLIRRIVENWDWRRFKPPVVTRNEDGRLEVIDGQHTSIAAVTHPDITEIPVMVVQTSTQAERAQAFVGHNRDRLAITQQQMHYSAAAAGDEEALTINQVCQRAGVRILKSPPPRGKYEVGDTLAIAAIRALVKRRYAMKARQVLEVLVKAQCAPVSANFIKAVEALLFDDEFAGTVDGEGIANTIIRMSEQDIEREGRIFGNTHKLPTWRGVVTIIYRNTRKLRKAG